MRETLKRLIKLSAGYSLVTLIGPLFTLFLTPLYTRVLDPADYGVVDVALTLTGLLGTVVTLGIEVALNSHFWNCNDEPISNEFQRNIATTAVISVASLSLMAGAFLFAFAQPVANILYGDVAREETLRVAAFSLAFAPVYSVSAALLRLRMGVKRVNALGIIYLVTFIACNLMFVLVLRLRANGVIGANAAATFAGAVTGLVLLWKPLRGSYEAILAKRLVYSGIALVPSLLGLLLLANADRLILTQFVDKNELGIYAIANRISSILSVVLNAAITAWVPMALSIAHQDDAEQQFARVTEWFLTGACLMALVGGLFAREILSLLTRAAYLPAAPYAALLMGYNGPIIAMSALFSIGFYIQKKERLISLAYLVAVILNISLNLLLDKGMGILGATLATLAGGIGLMATTYILCQQIYHLEYRWLRLGALFAIYCVLLALGLAWAGDSWIFRGLLVATFAVAIFALRIVLLEHIVFAANTIRRKVLTILG